MLHPLMGPLTELKDSELESKIQDLTNKYWMTRNPDIRSQIALVLDIHNQELMLRKQKAWEKHHEDMGNLRDLIKIN